MNPNSYSGYPCPYCKRLMDKRDFHLRPTRDHIIPLSRGGKTKIVCCLKCNGIKADMMPEVWAAYMAANPGWWLLLSRAERKARAKAARRLYDHPNGKGNYVRQGSPPQPPVIVPPELVFNFGHD